MISTMDLAWMAGVLDLKGRVIYKQNSQRKAGSQQVVLYVETIEQPVVDKLSAMTRINPEVKRSADMRNFNRRGCTEHCPEAHIHVKRRYGDGIIRTYKWTVTGVALVTIVTNVWDYLQVDRDYALVIQDINRSLELQGQGSARIMESLERLLNLGWTLPREYALAVERKLELGHSRTAA